jgi:hypothetical protein
MEVRGFRTMARRTAACAMRSRMVENKFHVTATSALECRVPLVPILISQSRRVVSDECPIGFGRADACLT